MAKIKRHTADSHKTKPKNVNKKSFERVYWPYIPMFIAIALLLSLSFSGGALQAAVKHPFGKVLSYSTSMSIGGLLADTNAQRAANGVPSLSLNNKLNAAAQANADDMAARDYWSHYTPDGNPPWIWVSNQGYSYQKLGQNLATGFSDEQSTIDGWMASPPHRENMLDSAFSEVGFGYANVPDYTAAGGGPQTVVVAFYGEPQVLAAATTAPAPSQTTPAASTPAASTPTPSAAAASTPEPAAAAAPAASQPATTDTPKKSIAAPTTTSHLQLAAPSNSYGALETKLAVILAIAIIAMWANRHIRAFHRWLMKGEHYAMLHPLTDLGLVVIAALLFILSQTAGLIQ
jgi:cell division septation protein DedD